MLHGVVTARVSNPPMRKLPNLSMELPKLLLSIAMKKKISLSVAAWMSRASLP